MTQKDERDEIKCQTLIGWTHPRRDGDAVQAIFRAGVFFEVRRFGENEKHLGEGERDHCEIHAAHAQCQRADEQTLQQRHHDHGDDHLRQVPMKMFKAKYR